MTAGLSVLGFSSWLIAQLVVNLRTTIFSYVHMGESEGNGISEKKTLSSTGHLDIKACASGFRRASHLIANIGDHAQFLSGMNVTIA